MKTINLIVRILTYPVILLLFIAAAIRWVIEDSIKWLKYGGEFVVSSKNTKDTIAKLFTLVESKNKE